MSPFQGLSTCDEQLLLAEWLAHSPAAWPATMSLAVTAARQSELVPGGGGAGGVLSPHESPAARQTLASCGLAASVPQAPAQWQERKAKKGRTPGSQGTVLGVLWSWEGIVKPGGILQKEARCGGPRDKERP